MGAEKMSESEGMTEAKLGSEGFQPPSEPKNAAPPMRKIVQDIEAAVPKQATMHERSNSKSALASVPRKKDVYGIEAASAADSERAGDQPTMLCERSSSISVIPALSKKKSLQGNEDAMTLQLLGQLDQVRLDLLTALQDNRQHVCAVFESIDSKRTGKLSIDEFCSALETLRVGSGLAIARTPHSPLLQEVRRTLAYECIQDNGHSVGYDPAQLSSVLLRPISMATLRLDCNGVGGSKTSYLAAKGRSRLLRAVQLQAKAEKLARVRTPPLPKLDPSRIREMLADIHLQDAYIRKFKESLDIVGCTPRLASFEVSPVSTRFAADEPAPKDGAAKGPLPHVAEKPLTLRLSPQRECQLPPLTSPHIDLDGKTRRAISNLETPRLPRLTQKDSNTCGHSLRSERRQALFKQAASHSGARELGSQSHLLLELLDSDPCDVQAARELDANLVKFKHDASFRMHWPYEQHTLEQNDSDPYQRRVREKPKPLEPPLAIPPPVAFKCTPHTIAFSWEKHAPRHDRDFVHTYELEISEISLLDGELPFMLANGGDADTTEVETSHVVRNLPPLTTVHARVRAVNRAGPGPWSDETEASTLDEEPKPPPVPLSDIPLPWKYLDLGDVYKENEKRTGGDGIITDEEREQQQRAINAVALRYMAPIKIAYRYYCLAGSSGSGMCEPDGMGLSQFLVFLKATGIDDKHHSIPGYDRLFIRATRPPDSGVTSLVDVAHGISGDTHELSAKLKVAHASHKLMNMMGNGEKRMHQHQFVAALVRLATQKYSAKTFVAEAFEKLVVNHLVEHVYKDLRLQHDAFSDIMSSQLMRSVLRKHRKALLSTFEYYAGVGQNSPHALGTIDLLEFRTLCSDLSLLDSRFGMREMLAAFVRVNIDDELFVQEEEGDTSSELVYDEYVEMVGRVFYGRVWLHMDTVEQERTQIEREFDKWLGEFYVPSVLAAISSKKSKVIH